jgi:hypothetical protein
VIREAHGETPFNESSIEFAWKRLHGEETSYEWPDFDDGRQPESDEWGNKEDSAEILKRFFVSYPKRILRTVAFARDTPACSKVRTALLRPDRAPYRLLVWQSLC